MTGAVGVIQTLNPSTFPLPNATTPPLISRNKSIKPLYSITAEINEIRVCTNRPCRRQGSMETLQVLSGINPPNIAVNSSGCLGRCGAGPNLVLLPGATYLKHCATAARAAEIMATVTGNDLESGKTSLETLSTRKKAEIEIEKGDFAMAEILLSEAIDLNPVGGLHYIYKARSVARLGMNKAVDALGDAIEASTLAPKYPEAYTCKGDALMAMEQFEAAGDSYSMALELDPSISRSKSFKIITPPKCPSSYEKLLQNKTGVSSNNQNNDAIDINGDNVGVDDVNNDDDGNSVEDDHVDVGAIHVDVDVVLVEIFDRRNCEDLIKT
ncbi:hypothetical protein LXL04_023377 [Taraxacum kok-saghyz]